MKRYLGLQVYNLQSTIIIPRVSFHATCKSLKFLYRFHIKETNIANQQPDCNSLRKTGQTSVSQSVYSQAKRLLSGPQSFPPMFCQNHAVAAFLITSHILFLSLFSELVISIHRRLMPSYHMTAHLYVSRIFFLKDRSILVCIPWSSTWQILWAIISRSIRVITHIERDRKRKETSESLLHFYVEKDGLGLMPSRPLGINFVTWS